jgi:hypothetical protein
MTEQTQPLETYRQPILVEIAPGELLDKITILEIKAARITDADKRHHVQTELAALQTVRDRAIPSSAEMGELTAELRQVNETLWDVEDAIRLCDREGDFGSRFVELARSVYRHNDRRAALKRRINELLGSLIREEKQYTSYQS